MNPEDAILGQHTDLLSFDSRLQNRALITELCRQSSQHIRIFSQDLEPLIYDHTDILQTLTRLMTRNRRTRVQVLVKDATAAIQNGHRLIELSRRLSSSLSLHKMPDILKNDNSAYLIADDAGYCHKHQGHLYQGKACFNDKLKVRDMIKTFDEYWEQSHPDPELRRLYI